jgi:hypothetical protein
MPGELQIGQGLDCRFRITALLSEGGIASFYEAHDRWTDTTTALKVPFSRYDLNVLPETWVTNHSGDMGDTFSRMWHGGGGPLCRGKRAVPWTNGCDLSPA